jgi:preprotein translocase subunit SecE
MVKRPSTKHVRKALKKEVNLPIPMPDNKVGNVLKKHRRVPGSKYVVDSFAELKKVIWPTRRESWKLTTAVIIFTAIFMLIISLADYGINLVVERVFL